MSPGECTDRIVIQQKTTVADSQGGRTKPWSTLATVWANVRAASANERVRAEALGSQLSFVITTYYRADVTPSMRIALTKYKATTATTLEIHGVAPVDSQREWMTLECAEVA